MTRSFVKLKGLQKAFKESGKSFDEFMKLAQMNKDIPQDIAKALRKTKIMSEGLGVTAEVATDLATTYALQKDGATTTDWVMSITSTLAGTATFKQLASKLRGLKSNPSATIQEIKQTFSALDLTDAEVNEVNKVNGLNSKNLNNDDVKYLDEFASGIDDANTPVRMNDNITESPVTHTENLTNPPVNRVRKPLEEPGLRKIPSNLKSVSVLVPDIKPEELKIKANTLVEYIDPNKLDDLDKPNNKRLTKEAEELVWKAAEGLRNNALSVENDIVRSMFDAGLATSETLKHRSKGLQSLHDKIRTYLIENPDSSFEEAIRSVKDSVGVRTVNESKSFADHPEVKELLEKGDTKSAINKAVELESDYVLQGLMKIVDKMADGTAEIKLTRVANYMGEDGIPYFTESQLNKLRAHAAERGIEIPIISRVVDAKDRASINNVYSDEASTKIRKSGYTALQMNFETKDGDIFEWQYRGDKLNDFGEGEHVPYDLRTGKDIIGKDVVLKPLYEPMKNLLTNKDIMPDDLYKEYNAYLTAHYKYLRLTELGFDAEEPKLPKGIDERLRAENLILLHDVADRLKNGKISQEDALKEYNQRLIRNTDDNVTDISYKKQLDDVMSNQSLDRYESNIRLRTKNPDAKNRDLVYLRKACSDENGEIKANLVHLSEVLQSKGYSDKIIASFINSVKYKGNCDVDKIINLFDNLLSKASYKLPKDNILLLVQSAVSKEGKLNDKTVDFIKSFDINNMFVFSRLQKFVNRFKMDDGSLNPKAMEFYQELLQNGDREIIGLSMLLAMPNDITRANFEMVKQDANDLNLSGEILKTVRETAEKYPQNTNLKQQYADIIRFLIANRQKLPQNIENLFKFSTKKDGTINDDVLNVYKQYIMNYNLNSDDAVNIINSMYLRNSEAIQPEENKLVTKVLDDVKNSKQRINPALILSLLRSTYVNTNVNGKLINVHSGAMANIVKNLYETLPAKVFEIPAARVQRVINLAKAMTTESSKGTRLPNDLKDAVLHLDEIGVDSQSILEVSNRYLKLSDGNFNKENYNKLLFQYNKLSEEEKKNIIKIQFVPEAGILRQILTIKDSSGKINNVLTDINIQNTSITEGVSTFESKQGKKQRTVKQRDVKRNSSSKLTYTPFGKLKNETRVYNDPITGERVSEQISETGINGVLDVRTRDSNGNTKILSTAYRDESGNTIVKQDFVSLNGTRSQYNYTESPNGNHVSDYVITDKNGNELLNLHREFNVIDDNHFSSSANGHNYDMKIDDDRILTVTNDKGESVKFDLDSFTQGNFKTFQEILENIPGDEWFNIAKTGLVSLGPTNVNNAFYTSVNNDIHMGRGYENISTFLHEFGHNKDFLIDDGQQHTNNYEILEKQKLSTDNGFTDIYNRERSEFIKAFPSLERDIIDYFIGFTKSNENRTPDRGKKEVFAEGNTISNTPYQKLSGLEFRTNYLTRYFPESLAYSIKKLNPDIFDN